MFVKFSYIFRFIKYNDVHVRWARQQCIHIISMANMPNGLATYIHMMSMANMPDGLATYIHIIYVMTLILLDLIKYD